jgi:hypothetical protein
MSSEPASDEPQLAASTSTASPDGSFKVSFTRPQTGEPISFIASRKAKHPTYQQLLDRRTPQQQAAFREKRRLLQAKYRAQRKAALVPGS